MSVQEEILRIRHEQQGEQALRDAERRYEDLRAAVHDLDAQLRAGEITEKAHADAINRLGRAVADAGKEVQVFQRLAADASAMQAQAAATAAAEARMKALGAAVAAYAAMTAPLPAKTGDATQALAEYAGMATKAAAATKAVAATGFNFAIDTGRLDLAERQMSRMVGSAGKLGDLMGRSGKFGYGMLQASYIFDDLQYGLASVVNNIPIFLSSMGVGAGVAGALGMVAVVGSQAVKHIGDLKGLFESHWEVPKAAIGSAQNLKDQLKGVNDELEKLTKKGYLTDGERGRYDTLMGRRKEFEEAEAARASAEAFRKSRPQSAGEAGSAFAAQSAEVGAQEIDRAIRDAYRKHFANLDPAVIVADAQREAEQKDSAVLDIEGSKRRLAQRFETLADKAIKGLKEGSVDAFEQAVGLLESTFGKGDPRSQRLRIALSRLQKKVADQDFTGPPAEAIYAVDIFRQNEAKRVSRELTEQGQENQEAFQDRMADQATGRHGDIYGDALNRQIILGRAAGLKAPDEIRALRESVGKELMKVAPELKAFPERMKQVRDGIVLAARDAVDKTIDELRATEGLTRRQAVRRLANREREAQQAAAGQLAGDEFTELAGRMDAEARRRNPFARRMSARERREAGEQMRRQFEGLGLSEEEQARAARVLGSHPMAGMMMQERMGQFAGIAPDQRTAFLMALENMEGGGGNALTARQANAMQRAQGRAFNAAIRQQGRDINEAERIMRRGGLPPAAPYVHPVRNRAADAGPADPVRTTEDNSKATAENTKAVNELTAALSQGITGIFS